MSFQQGQIPWNKGKSMPEETRAKNRKSHCKWGHKKIAWGSGVGCQQCAIERGKRRYNNESVRDHLRESRWTSSGVVNSDGTPFTIQDYNRAFQIQGGMCKICGDHQSELSKRLATDHDHASGIFRGLLCQHCNIGIAHARDNSEILKNMIRYLEGVPRGKDN